MQDTDRPLDGFEAARAALAWSAEMERTPTSSLTGGGAIAALELDLGILLGGWSLALPSGSSALQCALRVVGVRSGEYVSTPASDWFGGPGVVQSVGAIPCPRTAESGADYAAAIFALNEAFDGAGHWPIVCDAARAAPSDFEALRLGRWDALALSFGPGKAIDAGEGGAVVLRSEHDRARAVSLTQHPVRQRLAGDATPLLGPGMRIHPVGALIALHQLRKFSDPTVGSKRHAPCRGSSQPRVQAGACPWVPVAKSTTKEK